MLVLSDFIFFSVIKFSSIQIENIRCQAKEKTNDCYKLLYGIKIAIDVKRISNLVFFNWLFSFLNFVLPYSQNKIMRTTDLTDIQAIYLINFHVDRVLLIIACMSLISVVLINFLPNQKKRKKKKEKRKTQLRKLKKQLKNIKLRFFFWLLFSPTKTNL